MRWNIWGYSTRVLLLVALLVVGGAGTVMANTASSPNYEVTETEFGAGAALESCSGQYCAKATIGSLTDESGESPTSTADFGPIATDSEPLLEVVIDDGVSNLGVLDIEKTSSKTTTVRVRSYLSNGYTMHIMGDSPVYGTHHLSALQTPTASTPGIEQFGVNVVKNTTPDIGADPVQVPSDQMSFGEVMPSYGTPDRFMYSDGDVVARSDTESGRTDYTISMIINVAGSTPAGHYTSDFSVVVIPVF